MPALRTRDAQSQSQSRSLEVSTDTPQPPTLAIISPTPRAFTFPTSHNLADSPFSSPSPSSSPFELACTPPPSSYRTLSPATTASPSPTSRRPKKGDEDYIKRPENAFILFRRKCCEDRQDAAAAAPTKKQRQADLSKTISQQWKGLSPEDRHYWEQLAKEKKKEHEQMYPNYVYRPQRTKKSNAAAGKKGSGGRRESVDSEYMSFVLPMRQHGRSSSAPSPYQAIQIPNVYMSAPSCPTSPSLLPMISASRRSSDVGFRLSARGVLRSKSSEYVYDGGGGGGLTSTNTNELLPPAQITSPPSSICSSPRSGPFTPQNYTPPSSLDLQQEQAELDLTMHLFDSSSWWAPQDPTTTSSAFSTDDFDMNSIPPIDLGMPKFHGVVDDYPGSYAFDFESGTGLVVDDGQGHAFGL
ncbi:hypothetical protein F5146DRAFT_1137034 [Armillaria mellea]|nr:hypothetical protein F5146DRAFT_1137034 [Armillaria mellea]